MTSCVTSVRWRRRHQRGHALPAAVPAPPRGPRGHDLARVRGRATAPLLPHHRVGGSRCAPSPRSGPVSRRRRRTDHRGDLMDMTQPTLPGAAAIDGYIGRVDAAARALPPDRRVELLDQLREHLEAVFCARRERVVRSRGDRPTGRPAEIVASEDTAPTAQTPPAAGTRSPGAAGDHGRPAPGRRDLPDSGHRTVGGTGCAWLSPAWTRGEIGRHVAGSAQSSSPVGWSSAC